MKLLMILCPLLLWSGFAAQAEITLDGEFSHEIGPVDRAPRNPEFLFSSERKKRELKERAQQQSLRARMRGESEFLRQEKQFLVMLNALGRYNLMPPSLELGYYLSPNLILFAELSNRYQDDPAERPPAANTNYRLEEYRYSTALGAGARLFLANSFFVDGSLFTRKLSFYSEQGVGNTITGQETLEERQLGVSLGVGNQWQWKSFTAGWSTGLSAIVVNRFTPPAGSLDSNNDILNNFPYVQIKLGLSL